MRRLLLLAVAVFLTPGPVSGMDKYNDPAGAKAPAVFVAANLSGTTPAATETALSLASGIAECQC